MLPSSELDAFYRAFPSQRKADNLVHLIQPGQDVLDIGCGDGAVLADLADRVELGVAIGFDPLPLAPRAGLELIQADIEAYLEGYDQSFDVMICNHVVEHLPGEAMEQLRQLVSERLRPGGKFILEYPKIAALGTMMRYYYIDPTHLPPRHHALMRWFFERAGLAYENARDVNQDFEEERFERIWEDRFGELDPKLKEMFFFIMREMTEARDIQMVFTKPDA